MKKKKSSSSNTHLPIDQFNQELCLFLDNSPTPFHAVENLKQMLTSNGFCEIKEEESWDKIKSKKCFVIKNQSSIVAFIKGQVPLEISGIKLFGAHTDSPCLKVKPQPEKMQRGYYQLGVEVYGGALYAPWFDRDLSLAGRVHYLDSKKNLLSTLVDFKRPLAIIPSLAIHLNRGVNESHSINAQKELPPLLMQYQDHPSSFRELLKEQLKKENPKGDVQEVQEYELSFYDTCKAGIIGWNRDFISSARLDNLLSCFVGVKSFLNSCQEDLEHTCVLACLDHEEVGSSSHCGADGPFLHSVLERLAQGHENFHRMIEKSLMISADNAHGVHPNYPEKHDENHGPILNNGPVIKINSNQRYATNSETAAVFSRLCQLADVPFQRFVVRSDMACGSTIGPITASNLGIKVVDVGIPTFAMHSIRELCGQKDSYFLFQACNFFFSGR